MGMLDIRMRSERLQVAPRVRTQDYMTAANIKAQNSDQLVRSLSNGLASLGNLGLKLAAGVQKRHEDGFIGDYQKAMNAYNNGDENTLGAMQMEVDDEGKWVRDNVDFRNRTVEDLRKKYDLSDNQLAQVQQRLQGFDMTMQNQWTNRAHAIGVDRDLGAAKDRFDSAQLCVVGDDVNENAWTEWHDAGENYIEKMEQKNGRAFSDEEKRSIRRGWGLGIASTAVKRLVANTEIETDGDDDEKRVARKWDEQISFMEGTDDRSFLPASSFQETEDENGNTVVTNHLSDALDGANLSEMKKAAIRDMELAKKKAVTNSRGLFNKNAREANISAYRSETDFISGNDQGETWRGLTNAERVQRYDDYLKSDSGMMESDGTPMTWEQALKKYNPTHLKTVMNAMDTFRKADQKQAAKVVSQADKDKSAALRKQLCQPTIPQTDEDGNFVYDSKGVLLTESLTPQRRMEMAYDAFNGGTMTKEDFAATVNANTREFTSDMNEFCTRVLTEMGAKFKKAVQYRGKNADGTGSFEFVPQTELQDPNKTAFSDYHKYGDKKSGFSKEDVAWNDVVDAMDLTQTWLQTHPDKTVDDAVKYCKGILRGRDTEGNFTKMKIQEKLAHEKSMLNILQNRRMQTGPEQAAPSVRFGRSPSGRLVEANGRPEAGGSSPTAQKEVGTSRPPASDVPKNGPVAEKPKAVAEPKKGSWRDEPAWGLPSAPSEVDQTIDAELNAILKK